MTEKILDRLQDNEPLHLAVGENFLVRLPQVPTTGYRWTVEVFPNESVELIDDSFSLHKEALIGGGGVRTFRFVAVKKGKSSLNFFLQRQWENKEKAVEVRHYQLFIS